MEDSMKTPTIPWLLIFVLSAGSLFAGADETAMFQNDCSHSGLSSSASLGSVSGLAFSFTTQGAIRSVPVFYRDRIYFGSNDGTLYAVDATSGELSWNVNVGWAVNSSPAAGYGMIFFTARDHRIRAVDAATGKLKWVFRLGDDLRYEPGFDYYSSSPAIDQSEVFVGGGDGYLYCLDAKTGNLKWKFNSGVRLRTSPALTDDKVVFGTMGGHLIALDRKNGKEVWRFATLGASLKLEDYGYDRSGIVSSPSIADGIVTAGCRDGIVYAVDLANGQLVWKYDHNISWPISTPGRHDGQVFVGTSDGRFFQSINAKTGEEQWRTQTAGNVFSSPALTVDQVYFGDLAGYIYGCDQSWGKELWRVKTGGAIYASPMIHGGIVYCGSDDGVMYALRGHPLPEQEKPAKIIYWEDRPGSKWFKNGLDQYIRDYFKNEGYKVFNAAEIAEFMKQRLQETGRSVVVFANNRIPAEIAENETEHSLIRKYLDSGGKVVFLGTNPMAYRRDSTGAIFDVDFSFAARTFGVRYPNKKLDHLGWYHASVTREGLRWGLRGWWVGFGAIDPKDATTVLGVDEEGMAACWVKNYGGPDGTGLVQLWIPRDHMVDLTPIQLAIEYGL